MVLMVVMVMIMMVDGMMLVLVVVMLMVVVENIVGDLSPSWDPCWLISKDQMGNSLKRSIF